MASYGTKMGIAAGIQGLVQGAQAGMNRAGAIQDRRMNERLMAMKERQFAQQQDMQYNAKIKSELSDAMMNAGRLVQGSEFDNPLVQNFFADFFKIDPQKIGNLGWRDDMSFAIIDKEGNVIKDIPSVQAQTMAYGKVLIDPSKMNGGGGSGITIGQQEKLARAKNASQVARDSHSRVLELIRGEFGLDMMSVEGVEELKNMAHKDKGAYDLLVEYAETSDAVSQADVNLSELGKIYGSQSGGISSGGIAQGNQQRASLANTSGTPIMDRSQMPQDVNSLTSSQQKIPDYFKKPFKIGEEDGRYYVLDSNNVPQDEITEEAARAYLDKSSPEKSRENDGVSKKRSGIDAIKKTHVVPPGIPSRSQSAQIMAREQSTQPTIAERIREANKEYPSPPKRIGLYGY